MCEFGDPAKEIKDHIILTCTCNSLRRRAFRDNLDLTNLMKTGKAIELSEKQASQVEQQEFSSVHYIYNSQIRKPQAPPNRVLRTNDHVISEALSKLVPEKPVETAVGQTRISESAEQEAARLLLRATTLHLSHSR
jgi:hypothetical protein